MTDHLSECLIVNLGDWERENAMCICAQLRACEARVMETRLAAHRQEWIADGYFAGVQAARDAVAALPGSGTTVPGEGKVLGRADALATIDALRNDND